MPSRVGEILSQRLSQFGLAGPLSQFLLDSATKKALTLEKHLEFRKGNRDRMAFVRFCGKAENTPKVFVKKSESPRMYLLYLNEALSR